MRFLYSILKNTKAQRRGILTSLLKQFDDIQLGTLHRLFGGMDDLSDEQAKLGVNAGGLGIRAARDVALPAVLASKIMAEPKVEFMLQQLRIAGLITDDRLLTHFRKGIDQAVHDLCEHLKQRAWGNSPRAVTDGATRG